MKPIFRIASCIWLTAVLVQFSCRREYSCERCGLNGRPPLTEPGNHQAPVAIAGADQVIHLPTDSILLDGSTSSDADGTISNFSWSKLSGPDTLHINDPHLAKTLVTKVVAGAYQFILAVTDNDGITAKDTIQITILPDSMKNDCNISNRSLVNVKLVNYGALSRARLGTAVAAVGTKILYAGGFTLPDHISQTRVDIFDIPNHSWKTAELSEPRSGISTAVLGSKVFFAGGYNGSAASSTVDIYDAQNNSWSTAHLSAARFLMAGAAAGKKVVFAGGTTFDANSFDAPPVDIYDAATDTWSTDHLRNRATSQSIGDAGIAATVIGTKIYFAGNASDCLGWDFGSITSTINVYDAGDNTWSTSDLSIPRGFMAGIAIGNLNIWAGGVYKQPADPLTGIVEIRDMNTGSSTFGCLLQPNAFITAIQKDNKVVIINSGESQFESTEKNKFDIYDLSTSSWSIGVMERALKGSTVIGVDNNIYVAGGYVNGIYSNQVFRMDF